MIATSSSTVIPFGYASEIALSEGDIDMLLSLCDENGVEEHKNETDTELSNNIDDKESKCLQDVGIISPLPLNDQILSNTADPSEQVFMFKSPLSKSNISSSVVPIARPLSGQNINFVISSVKKHHLQGLEAAALNNSISPNSNSSFKSSRNHIDVDTSSNPMTNSAVSADIINNSSRSSDHNISTDCTMDSLKLISIDNVVEKQISHRIKVILSAYIYLFFHVIHT
jgi:hypothetical protein